MFSLTEPEKNVRFDPNLDLNMNVFQAGYRLIPQVSTSDLLTDNLLWFKEFYW